MGIGRILIGFWCFVLFIMGLYFVFGPKLSVEARNDPYSYTLMEIPDSGLRIYRHIEIEIKNEMWFGSYLPIKNIEVFDIGVREDDSIEEHLPGGKQVPIDEDEIVPKNALETAIVNCRFKCKSGSHIYTKSSVKFPYKIIRNSTAAFYAFVVSSFDLPRGIVKEYRKLRKPNTSSRIWGGFLKIGMDKLGYYRVVKYKESEKEVILPGPQPNTLLIRVHSFWGKTEEAILY